MTRLLILALFLAASLAGCATTGAPGSTPANDPYTKLQEQLASLDAKTVIDLDAATARALAPPADELAAACFPALKRFLTEQLNTSTPTVGQLKGFFDAYETARKLRIKAEGSSAAGPQLPTYLKLGCAALVQDERDFAIRIGLLVAAASAGAPGVGAAAGQIPGLAGGALQLLGPALPIKP